MRESRETTREERIQIVRECIACGKNYGQMALKDQVPRTELEKAQIEIEQLKHKLYLAEMECDLLKKLDEIERRDAYQKRGNAIFTKPLKNAMKKRVSP